jgi:hypothetical protein
LKIYEDLSTFRCKLKTLGRTIVRENYDIFAPSTAKLSAAEHIKYTRAAVAELSVKGKFLRGGVDENVCMTVYVPLAS